MYRCDVAPMHQDYRIQIKWTNWRKKKYKTVYAKKEREKKDNKDFVCQKNSRKKMQHSSQFFHINFFFLPLSVSENSYGDETSQMKMIINPLCIHNVYVIGVYRESFELEPEIHLAKPLIRPWSGREIKAKTWKKQK